MDSDIIEIRRRINRIVVNRPDIPGKSGGIGDEGPQGEKGDTGDLIPPSNVDGGNF